MTIPNVASAATDAIPNVIWSGVFGAVVAASISLVGVWLANRSSLKRLHVQHLHDAQEAQQQRLHDAKQKGEDRKAAIRREVYTEAVEAVHTVLSRIGELPNTRLGDPELSKAMTRFLESNSKVWLVAESKAAHLSRKLAELVTIALIQAQINAHSLRAAREPWWDLGERVEFTKSEIGRIERALMEAGEQGQSSRVQGLQESLMRQLAFLNELKSQRDAISHGHAVQSIDVLTALLPVLRPVQEQIVNLVGAIRAELDLVPDVQSFMDQMLEGEQNMKRLVESLKA